MGSKSQKLVIHGAFHAYTICIIKSVVRSGPVIFESNQRINSSGITCYLYTCYLYDEYSLYWGREASLTAKRNQTRERKKHGGRHKTREEGKTNDVGVRSMGNPKTQMVTV
ncbi:hypothetical protein POUND7_012400 [Theobroma cacao]